MKILTNILKNDKDPYETDIKFFESHQEYLAYKPFLIQMLHLDAYLYLLQEQAEDFLIPSHEIFLNTLEKRITQGQSTSLPPDDKIICLMLSAFYYFNVNRKKLITSYPGVLEKIKKESRSRIHPAILLNYIF